MRYGCMSLDEVTPHDYYQYHTKQTDRSTGIFFLTYPELKTAASLTDISKLHMPEKTLVDTVEAIDVVEHL
jgi:hypothetical protein